MAELASGAVSSLLGVIRNEAALLGGVRGDVQFIKEEMESMNSFLEHLARTVPPSGEHDPQVRTWMGQVRLLAQDCNNCIDLYLYRGNPEIHLPKRGPLRYLGWAPWFLQKLVAQHRAAVQLRELKDRARDVGERRLRYGVEVPEKAATAARQSSPASGAATTLAGEGAGDDELQFDRQLVVAMATATDHSGGLRAFFEPPTLDDYFEAKLVAWIRGQTDNRTRRPPREAGSSSILQSTAIVVATNGKVAVEEDKDNDDSTNSIMDETSAVAEKHFHDSVIVVSVDIPAVHWDFGSLPRPKDILFYILRALALKLKPGVTDEGIEQFILDLEIDPEADVWDIYWEKREVFYKIKRRIREMEVDEKFDKVMTQIKEAKHKQLWLVNLKQKKKGEIKKEIRARDLFVLIVWLVNPAAADEQATKKAMSALQRRYDNIIDEAAKKLKRHVEEGREETTKIHLQETQYKNILQEVFHKTSSGSESLQATTTTTSTAAAMVDDQIKEMIHKVTEMLQDLQEDNNSGKQQQASRPADGEDRISDDIVREATEKIDSIRRKVREHLKIQWMVDRIKDLLDTKKALIILKTNDEIMDASRWEETRSNALSLLDSVVVGTLIFTTTSSTQKAKQYCYPQHQEPIQYSLVGLYHDTVLNLTRQHRNYSPQIFRAILDQCEQHEFCMKIFAHALYANPKRSNEELLNLHSTLRAISPRSFASIAKKMFKFSYNDLPKEYKSCLLYLAIFRPGQKIRRSTLIGRWVVEGLITTEDWRWSSSVNRARRCFDALIDQWLIYPADIGATGEVKSCMVGDIVHGLITKIAEKQRIMETRLSHHLACHFSISNDLRLRGSDKIDDFLGSLSQPSQFSLLKVLDLEGCQCFGANSKRYFKNICRKIKLLKYLNLRATDITQLHSEINSLHELEVLDIRQTVVSPSATRDVRLLKLKRLLAGDPVSPSSTNIRIAIDGKRITTSVEIPEKVENMEGMEVLSNVKPRSPQDLKDIGRLWQLRKLGVVIEDRRKHLKGLLQAIWNLSDCLRSLSITIVPKVGHSSSKGSKYTSIDGSTLKKKDLKVLESLSISGSTKKDLGNLSISGNKKKVQLLELLLDRRDKENNPLTKVSLSKTHLSQEDLEVLANLPKLLCLRLRHKAYNNHSKLTFKEGQFQHLKYFLVEGSNMTDIIFEDRAAGELEKIVLPLCDGLNLSGVDKLQRLKELELNNSNNGGSSKNNSNENNGEGKNTITDVTATNTSATNNNNIDATATATPTIETINTHGTNNNVTAAPTTAAATNNNNIDAIPTPTIETTSTHGTNTNVTAVSTTAAATNNNNIDATATATPTIETTSTHGTTTNVTTAPTTAAATTTTTDTATPAGDSNASTRSTNNDPITGIANTPVATNDVTTTNTDASAPTTTTDASVPATTDNVDVTINPNTTVNKTNMFLSFVENAKGITKVTLRGTMLKEDDIKILAKKPTISCLVLLDKSYDKSQLTFNTNEFPKLNLLIVECDITDISFMAGSCPKLKRFVWTFTKINSLSGIDNLPRLKELEFKGDFVPNKVRETIRKIKNRIHFTHYESENQGQAKGNLPEEYHAAKSPCFWKNKGWCWRN